MATPEPYRVHLFRDPLQAGARAAALFAADPIGTNVLTTVLAAVRAGQTRPGSTWAVADDAADRPVGAALCTPGYPPFLTPMPDAAATGIARELHRAGHDVAAVRGDAGATHAFALRWCGLTGCDGRRVSAEGVHELDRLVPPAGIAGSARTASADDEALIIDWYEQFELQATPGGTPPTADSVRARAGSIVHRIAEGQVALWTDGGGPVSMAGWQVPSAADLGSEPLVGRIGPVYTPPEHRGHGYAAAVTAAATRQVLAAGAARVMLYTDLANATSGGIYTRLGYRHIGAGATWVFEAPRTLD